MYKRRKKFDSIFTLPKHKRTRYCKRNNAVVTERLTSQWSSAKLLLLAYFSQWPGCVHSRWM